MPKIPIEKLDNVVKKSEFRLFSKEILEKIETLNPAPYQKEIKSLISLKNYIEQIKDEKKLFRLFNINPKKITTKDLSTLLKIKKSKVDFNLLYQIENLKNDNRFLKNKKLQLYFNSLLTLTTIPKQIDNSIIKILQNYKQDIINDSYIFIAGVLFLTLFSLAFNNYLYFILSIIIYIYLFNKFWHKNPPLWKILKNKRDQNRVLSCK